jgi:DNA-binding transcriptional LysR family regulator
MKFCMKNDGAVTVRGESPGDLNKLVMMRGEYAVIMRPGHHLAGCSSPAIEDFVAADHVLVAPRGQPGSIIARRLSELGLERRVARKVSSFWAAMVLVARSDYIAILPRAAVQAMKRQVELETVPPPFPLAGFPYDLVWHKRLDGDPAQQWFRGLLLRCAEHVEASGLS